MSNSHQKKKLKGQARQDERFQFIQKDPRFKPIKQDTKKIKLDSRFAEIFDDKFNTNVDIDKYGRPAQHGPKSQMAQFYEIESASPKQPQHSSQKGKQATSRASEMPSPGNKQQQHNKLASPKPVAKASPQPGKGRALTKEAEEEDRWMLPAGDEGASLQKASQKQPGQGKQRQNSHSIAQTNNNNANSKKSQPQSVGKKGKFVPPPASSSSEEESKDDDDGSSDRSDDSQGGSDASDSSGRVSGEDSNENEYSSENSGAEYTSSGEENSDGSEGSDQDSDEDNSDSNSDSDSMDSDDDSESGTFSTDLEDTSSVEYGLDVPPPIVSEGEEIVIEASDLWWVFNSFLPPKGTLKSVIIYFSNYGLQMQEYTWTTDFQEHDEAKYAFTRSLCISSDVPAIEDATFRFEESKLLWHFAVCEFDSPATAEAIFVQLNLTQLEMANQIEFHFVDDEMSFEGRKISSQCTEKPKTRPRTEIQNCFHSKLKLSWDDTDRKRRHLTSTQFNKEEINNYDFDAYLASSSSEESLSDAEEKKKILKGLVGEFDAKIESVEKEKLRRRLLRAENERKEREGLHGPGADGEVTEFTGSMSANIQERTSELVNSLKNEGAVKLRPHLLKRKELKKARKEKLQRKEEERVGKRIPRAGKFAADDGADSSDSDDGEREGFEMDEERVAAPAGRKRKKSQEDPDDPFAGWDEIEFEDPDKKKKTKKHKKSHQESNPELELLTMNVGELEDEGQERMSKKEYKSHQREQRKLTASSKEDASKKILSDDRFGGKLLADERFAREIGALKNRNADAEADNLTRAIITEKYSRADKQKKQERSPNQSNQKAGKNNANNRSPATNNNNSTTKPSDVPVSSLVSKIKANFK